MIKRIVIRAWLPPGDGEEACRRVNYKRLSFTASCERVLGGDQVITIEPVASCLGDAEALAATRVVLDLLRAERDLPCLSQE